MRLSKENTKILQGLAILFMLALHLFNRVDIVEYYDVHLFVGGGGTTSDMYFLHV